MSFWKTKAYRIWRLFHKKVGARAGTDSTKFDLGAFTESLSLFRQTGEDIYLQHAVQNGQTAFSQNSLELSIRSGVSVALATLFTEIYDQNYDLDSLKSMIEYSQQAVELIPAGNPDRATLLNNLSIHLITRYLILKPQSSHGSSVFYIRAKTS